MSLHRKAIAVVLVICLTAGAGVYLATNRDDYQGASAPHARLPLPTRSEAERSLAFIDDRGAPLMAMHTAADQLVHRLSPALCGAAADRLNHRAPPDRVLGLIAGVVDPPLRAAFAEERRWLGLTLTRCVRGNAHQKNDIAKLKAVTRIATLRLKQLERAAR